MRKMVATALAIICVVGLFTSPLTANAQEGKSAAKEVYITVDGTVKQVRLVKEFADGSKLYEGKVVTLERTRAGLTGQKPYYCRNSNGEVLWTATVVGTFTYNGRTSSCTNARCSTTIYGSSWSEESCTAHTSGTSAVGSVVMIRKWLFFTLESIPVTITLTCDQNGNLS